MVLEMEKKKCGITDLEDSLSALLSRSNDPVCYRDYLLAAVSAEGRLNAFYRQEKWRGWKFRMFCLKKSSLDKLLDRISDAYGRDCCIYYGDWSERRR